MIFGSIAITINLTITKYFNFSTGQPLLSRDGLGVLLEKNHI
jgi:hypothetical protein